MEAESILAFTGVAALLTIIPGPDMALVTKNALTAGQRGALSTTLGIVVGLMTWAAASALGIAALLAASATAFTVLKLAGAAYLIFLGLQVIWRSFRRAAKPTTSPAPKERSGTGSTFRQGLASNLLNPKIAVFYTTLLPQFIAPGDAVLLKSLLLAGIHNLMGLVWLTGYAWVVTRAGDLLRRPAARRVLDRLTGIALVTLGVRLAVDKR